MQLYNSMIDHEKLKIIARCLALPCGGGIAALHNFYFCNVENQAKFDPSKGREG